MIETIHQGLQADGITVSIAKLCRWFNVPRRTVYYKAVKASPKLDPQFVAPIKALIEESPSFGYRTVAHLLGFNKNTVQRVFQLLGWHLSRSGKACTAGSALEHALIARFGTLGRVPVPFLLRSDNGLVFTSRSYTALVRGYGLRQEFITPHCPQQNGMVERVIRTLKEQCAHRHRFETIQHASRVVGDWIRFYNHRRPHQALGMKTPAEAFALAA
ncbi:transposase [Bordetella trematum]|uniref:integrase core domain-containing protein n=1 Tax=Bordetella trematum TaxID=123899 RepID=UPI001404A9E3|nr:integrase core domain-containing protein [Bordetella trematum]QIM70231.1 transposase [Bordetella trematum]